MMRPFSIRVALLALCALLLLIAPFGVVHEIMAYWMSPRFQSRFPEHQAFWGGHPGEVLSHWLHIAAMGGSAALLAGFLLLERWARSILSPSGEWDGTLLAAAFGSCLFLGLRCLMLDNREGEGTAMFVYPVITAPTLAGSYFFLRRFVLRTGSFGLAALAAAGFLVFHLGGLLLFERSVTGGPNGYVFLFFPWLALAPLGVGVAEKLSGNFEKAVAEDQPRLLADLARMGSFWTWILVLLVAVTAAWGWQQLASSNYVVFRFHAPPVELALTWGAVTLLALWIAVRAQLIERGTAHAVLAMSVSLSIFSLLLTFFFGTLLGLSGFVLGLWASWLNAHGYVGLRYYSRHGSAWATRCLRSAPWTTPLGYLVGAVCFAWLIFV